MATIIAIASDDSRLFLPAEVFSAPRSVQNATMTEKDGSRLVKSSKRFKLFSEENLLLRIVEGSGFIKWARGEIPFYTGDIFRIQRAGELELNGTCTFIYCKENGE